MAREINKLSARTVQAAPGPGRFSDGGGLYLVVDPSGARRWLFIYRSKGKQREMGLGGTVAVSLADARRKRDEARRLLAHGIDPLDEKRRAESSTVQETTFGDFADQLIPELARGFRNKKHAAQWSATINAHAASLRGKAIHSIATDDVLAVLQPIWTSKSETASRLRGRIERILDAAKARGLRSGENPARWRGHMDQLLPKRRKLARGHHPAMPFEEVPTFITKLRERKGVAALALEFLILTAGRVTEVVGSRWDEVDERRGVWTVPAARIKAERDHRVPLSDRALAILRIIKEMQRGDCIFPGRGGSGHLSTGAFDALLERMRVAGATAHGFRSSFRDWAGEMTTVPREVAEAALAHAVGDETERAYRRGDALQKRRVLMQAWADYIEGSGQ